MFLVRKGYCEDIEKEYFFTDRKLAVKQAKVFLEEKEAKEEIYSSVKDGHLFRDDGSKGLEEFRQGKCKELLYVGSLWVELKEISISHAVVQPMIEVEGYMCSEPWDV